MAVLVFDSSIALWCMPDEGGTDQIQREVAGSGAIAPSHWPLEVANALLMAERRQRIDAEFRNCGATAYLELAQRRTLPLATLGAELRAAANALGIGLLGP